MVPEHAELAWIFNCVARMGWMSRMTQFKEKAGKDRENVSLGLFAYPALMAADILIYKATHVPVGEDQKQHLELTRDIAIKFNNDFAQPDFFPITEPLIFGAATRVMSLRDGTKKMSKSDPSDYSRINLTDDADAIAGKIRRAKTDPLPMPDTAADAEKRPDADNLLGIYAALADQEKDAVIAAFAGKQFSEFKSALTEIAVAKLGPVGAEMQRLMKDPAHVDKVLHDGAQRARAHRRADPGRDLQDGRLPEALALASPQALPCLTQEREGDAVTIPTDAAPVPAPTAQPFHPCQGPLHGGAFGGDLADEHDLLGAAVAAVLAEIDALGETDASIRGAQAPATAARQAHQHRLAALRQGRLDSRMEMKAQDEAPVRHR